MLTRCLHFKQEESPVGVHVFLLCHVDTTHAIMLCLYRSSYILTGLSLHFDACEPVFCIFVCVCVCVRVYQAWWLIGGRHLRPTSGCGSTWWTWLWLACKWATGSHLQLKVNISVFLWCARRFFGHMNDTIHVQDVFHIINILLHFLETI